MGDPTEINVCLLWAQNFTALVTPPLDNEAKFMMLILEYLPETGYHPSLRRTVLKKNSAKWALKHLKHYKSSVLSWSDAFRLQQQQHTYRRQPKQPYSPLRHEHASNAAQAAAMVASIHKSAKTE